MAIQIWRFLKELGSAETVKGGAESAKAVLELAKTLKEQAPKDAQLKPLIGQISSLLDVLNSPLAQIVGGGLPFLPLTAGLLKFYFEKTKQEPSLEQCVAIVSQVAFLESLRGILKLPENQTLLKQIDQIPVSDKVEQQLKNLGELQLDDPQAKEVVVCFYKSNLAEAFGEVLSARFYYAGLDKAEAKTLTERVARSTHQYINQALADTADALKPLAEFYRNGGQKELEKYTSINVYLEEQIAKKPLEVVFNENFTFKDIYVPLNAYPVDANGYIERDTESFELESWAKAILQDPSKQGQVMFVQGGPGRGKSVFCRMFANWVRQHFHPIWTPVLIRLRDIPKLQESFRDTLRDAVNQDFASSDPGWLTDPNTRYLFLLDGFDELVMQGRVSGGLQEFLHQVGQFQRDCHHNSGMGHQVLITGRPLALYSIERFMPNNLERVELLPMDNELQQNWFAKWTNLIDDPQKALDFHHFLQDSRCPDKVQELAREPLLLYLLAAMYRDGDLSVEMFEAATDVNTKIRIYEKSLDWVLTKQRSDSDHPNLNRNLTNLETEDLRRILSEAALCVVQSGGECAEMEIVIARLKDDSAAKLLLQKTPQQSGESGLTNALSVFYLEQSSQKGSVEFTHKSFSEFLCAQRLKESIVDWTRPGIKHQEFYISIEQLNWQIYDLLGYGGLTPEIVDYLMALLIEDKEFNPVTLFKRLENFYLCWCESQFIDAFGETLPQRKSRQLNNHKIELGQRQVDIYAGLNVIILLLKLHCYAQKRDNLKHKFAFCPCGYGDREQLLKVINYSNCINITAFNFTVAPLLSGVDLHGANLENTNLSGANLENANLSDANLSNANLSGANLKNADLSNANLSNANLSNAELNNVCLDFASFYGASFSSANLSGVQLNREALNYMALNGAILNSVDFLLVNLSRMNLSNVDLSHARLTGVEINCTDLSNAKLCGAELGAVNLENANLCGADLSNVIFTVISYDEINSHGTNLKNIHWDKDTKWENVRGLDTVINLPEVLKQQLGLK